MLSPRLNLNPEDLHRLVAEVVDYLDRYAARLRLGERAGYVAVQRGPGFLVYLRFQRGLQGLVGIAAGAEEVGLANEEALFRSSAMCRSEFIRAFSTGSAPMRLSSLAWAS